MMQKRRTSDHILLFCGLSVVALVFAEPITAEAQTDLDFGQALRWRNVGPFRGGRTRAIAGVPSQPNVFYMAQVNGGIFQTTDFGRTWQPIFDDQPTGSVGAIAVSISNPDTIYVGSGEGLHRPDLSVGDGIYRSADGGRTWRHLGLTDGQQIPETLTAIDQLWRRLGEARPITRDHTVASEHERLGILSAQEAAEVSTRHVLSRSLGSRRSVEPEIKQIALLSGDVLLLCSDGLHGAISAAEIADAIHRGRYQGDPHEHTRHS